ncbi:MAG: 6-phosphogluconolactonase [Candidatus Saccharibacteria bacterium]|nr:6-phosphogluconolactonase [Candidatus Saccharibacteria bacterium]
MVEFIPITKGDQETVSSYIAERIGAQLSNGKTVAWFVSGGSNIPVELATIEKLKSTQNPANLHIIMVDERFGPVGHANSNWHSMNLEDHNDAGHTLHPILAEGDTSETATQRYDSTVAKLIEDGAYTIGQFGLGADGHTAGLLPGNPVMESDGLYAHYHGKDFERITATPKLIARLDECILYASGDDKAQAFADMQKPGDENVVPSRILQNARKLTILSDLKQEEIK